MKSRNVIRTRQPFQGLVAFAPTLPTPAAAGSVGACGAAVHTACPTSEHLLARSEGHVHPGRGCA